MSEPASDAAESSGENQRMLRIQWRLNLAWSLLGTAKIGLDLLRGTESLRWLDGFRIVAVFGRSTTLALQHALKRDAPDYEARFYQAEVAAMKDDELMAWFLTTRNIVLKEAATIPDMEAAFMPYRTGADAAHMEDREPFARITVPLHHRGRLIDDTSLQNLAELYLDYLSDVLTRAEQEFVPHD